MQIKPAQPQDAKTLSEIVFHAAQELRGVDLDEAGWQLMMASTAADKMEAIINSSDYLVFCCWESDSIAGFISFKLPDHLMQLFVLPSARRKGIAQLLWDHAKTFIMNQAAATKIWVRSSSVAVPVYERFGFIVQGESKFLNGIRFYPMTNNITGE